MAASALKAVSEAGAPPGLIDIYIVVGKNISAFAARWPSAKRIQRALAAVLLFAGVCFLVVSEYKAKGV
jgi:hypothetical protein